MIARILAVAFVLSACAGSSKSALCTCAEGEKFDGSACVAAEDFVAPTDCVDDDVAVCGCDELGYTSKCKAFEAGVEVQYAGTCSASTSTGGGGFGW